MTALEHSRTFDVWDAMLASLSDCENPECRIVARASSFSSAS